MNNRQENQLGMMKTTAQVLTTHQAEFAAVSALVTEQANLQSSLDLIEQLSQAQQSPTTGITVDKQAVQEQMIAKALQVAGALKAYASVQNDNTLLKKADITPSSFTKVRDENRDDIAQDIHDLGNTNVAALAIYGVTAATLTALQTRIDAYRLIVVGPQTAKAQRSTITKALNDEMARAMMILHDRIDGLVQQFDGSGTPFHGDYRNSRKVIDQNGGPTPPQPPAPTPPAPPSP